MDHDDKPVGQIITRRQALSLGAVGLTLLGTGKAVASAPGVSLDEIDLVATPELTEGPFFIDNKLKRRNLIGATKRAPVLEGVPLRLKVTVYRVQNGKGVPLEGAHVDIWHADALGVYSGEPSSNIQSQDTRGQDWLRGYQITDEDGVIEFETIYPGWYTGRTSHIHFKIRTSANGKTAHEFTSQFFFDEKTNDLVLAKAPYDLVSRPVRNDQDGIYAYKQADGTRIGSHLVLRTKAAKTGYESEFSVALVI